MSLEKLIKLVGPNKFYEFWDLVNDEVFKNEVLPNEYYEIFVNVKDINKVQPCGDNGKSNHLLQGLKEC